MTSQLPETTPLVWYCSRYRKSYKVQPPTEDRAAAVRRLCRVCAPPWSP
ncbi:hypothetical protein ACWD3J_16380 [Streptomyces sp. NPDC002755]